VTCQGQMKNDSFNVFVQDIQEHDDMYCWRFKI